MLQTNTTPMPEMLTQEELRPLQSLPPRVFETERLRLRAIEPGEAQLIFDLYAGDAEISKYMSFKVTGDIKDTEVFCESAARRFRGEKGSANHYVWIIEDKASGEAVGSVGIGPIKPFALSGGYILNPKFWGKGYASEAWGRVVEWAKTEPGVFRIEATHDVDNPASGRVMEKAGMNYEGILRRYSVSPNVSDEPRDAAIYAWTRPA